MILAHTAAALPSETLLLFDHMDMLLFYVVIVAIAATDETVVWVSLYSIKKKNK